MSQLATTNFLNNIARNMRSVRLQCGLTQQQLADMSGVSRRTVIGIEAGSGNCSLQILDQLACAMGQHVVDLMQDCDTKERSASPLAIFPRPTMSFSAHEQERNSSQEQKLFGNKCITLALQAGQYSIARLPGTSPLPPWADGEGFVSISRSMDELSIVCLEQRIPQDVRQDRGWVCLKFLGPFAFGDTGIVLSVIHPLSTNGIGIFVVSTFDGDYLLVKQTDSARAFALLSAVGHSVLLVAQD